MRRGVALLLTVALLAGPAIVGFSSGGATDASRLAALVGALAVLGLAAVVTRGSLAPRSASGRWAVLALAAFAAWTLLSRTWAPTGARADTAFELAVLHLATLAAAALLLRPRAIARLAEPALALGAFAIVGYGVAGRLVPGIVDLAITPRAGGRLDQPLTYWNAMGALAGIGLVLATRLAGDETRERWLRAAGAAALPLFGAALYLSFSRAAIAATAAGVFVLIVLAPTWAQARAAVLAGLGTGLGIAATAPLDGVRALSGSLGFREREGVLGLLLLVAAMLLVAGLHLELGERVRARTVLPSSWRHAAVGALAVVAVLPFAAALADRSDAGSKTFGASTSRLAAAGSNRSAYWKVAVRSWADHPLGGEGAGSFSVTWLRERDIAERVRNAHSIELETASELGIVGLALLAAAIAALALAARRLLGEDAALAVGPAAALVAWLLHASVDWDWQVPGLTAVVMVLAGLLVARAGVRPRAEAGPAPEVEPAPTLPDPAHEAALSPPPGHPRFPMLDGVRAIAALSIVVLHVSDLSGFDRQHDVIGGLTSRLNVGVALFFVLSGFLLYRPFVAARLDGLPISGLGRYLRRRALRILPGYWVALAVLSALGWIVFVNGWWRFAFFLQPYNEFALFAGIVPAWTLAVEVIFYVTLPLWVLAARRLLAGRPREAQLRAELLAVAGLAVFGIAFRTACVLIQNPSLWAISFPAYVAWFAGGMALALASLWVEQNPLPRPVARLAASPALCWGLAFCGYLLLSYAVGLPHGLILSTPFANIAEHVLNLMVALLVALPAVLATRAVPRDAVSRAILRMLGHPLAIWLGLVSYGIFLYHDPFLGYLVTHGFLTRAPFAPYLLLLATTIAGAIVLGALSYYLVERPFLRFKDPRRSPSAGSAPGRARPRASSPPGPTVASPATAPPTTRTRRARA